MQKHSYLLLVAMLAGCVENRHPEQQADSTLQTDNKVGKPAASHTVNAAKKPLPDKIIGERADGSIQLMDSINGHPIAIVDDNTLLETGVPIKGWSATLVYTQINDEQEKNQLLKKGQPILTNNKKAGKALEDIPLETTFTNKEGIKTGMFHAVVAADKIKAGSIIEIALSHYLQQHSDRMLPDMQPFIKQFQLEPTLFDEPFQEYANYESAVDDPSPGYRTVLIFYKNQLIGVIDSRTLHLNGTKHYELQKGYNGYFFTDIDAKLRQTYIGMFNQFVNAAD
jgi:hypothetical protein